ncbi:MAG: ribonuclease III [Planctomycetota bacterium]
MDKKTLQQAEQMLGYKFSDKSLLIQSLTHSSQTSDRIKSNERLEFLGDAVLSLVICRTLFEHFPNYPEGDLTKIKSMLVSRRTCARLARQLGIERYLKVGKGMSQNPALKGSLAAGALESIIAAIYLDSGIDSAGDFILRIFADLIEKADAEQHQNNFKSVLQQYVQQNFDSTPIYELLDEKGPDHNKCFKAAVSINQKHFKSAWGTNKKDAEQKAAYNALVQLGVIEESSSSELE